MYKEYKGLNLPSVDKEISNKWESEGVYDKIKKGILNSEEQNQIAKGDFVFFEGPPSANGRPGIHHVLARTIKDIFCRYKTMCGYRVERKAGWDTHGLPVELGVEKNLNITKEDIGSKISIEQYNQACREEVMKYTQEWTELTHLMGYWIDLDNPYITYDNKYIETVWYLLKQLYDKGYLYKGYTIQPYSPAAGTGLSSHELNLPGCYKDVKDTTCTVQFKLLNSSPKNNVFTDVKSDEDIYILSWTTTPWTLPSNTALCVGESIDYVLVQSTNPYSHIEGLYVIAKARIESYFKELGLNSEDTTKILWEGKGKEMVGLEYEPIFPWWYPAQNQHPFRIISGDFVTTDEGTGIVHIAPTFGADDARVAKNWDIPALLFLTKKGEWKPMVDTAGKYFFLDELDNDFVNQHINTSLYSLWEGRYVKNSYDNSLTTNDETLDIALCMALKNEGKVFRIEKHIHSYPHCWRTDKPILYYPLDSWFIKVSNIRDRLVELNDTIHWQPPSTGSGRFGKWLENANDWNLSRSRFWGIPLPIWRSKDGKSEKCIGSIAQLMSEIDKAVAHGMMKENPWKNFKPNDYSKENYAQSVIDLHRPFVDDIVLVSDTGEEMYREKDLIDVWFDSGSMPYAQLHYPFENTDKPTVADFISEGVDQTRGWFYTLHTIHAIIDDAVAFRNVISTGLVLDKEGNKMSKRLGNAIDPFDMIGRYGADAVRVYMITNSMPWDNIKFDPAGVEEVQRKFFGTLYNTYAFYALYANVDGVNSSMFSQLSTSSDFLLLDKWVLSKLQTLIEEVTKSYENFDPTTGNRLICNFVEDDLSNWYVRLNRKRFWSGAMDESKLSAYYTLYTCLTNVAVLLAPIAPFYSDRLYRDLTDKSVHRVAWPVPNYQLRSTSLEEAMSVAQRVTGMILSLRKRAKINVRQPLNKVILAIHDIEKRKPLLPCIPLLKNEVNVKDILIVSDADEGIQVVKRAKPLFKVLGKRVGGDMREVAERITSFTKTEIETLEQGGTIQIKLVSGKTYTLSPEDIEIVTDSMPGWLYLSEGSITVALDTTISETLLQEGLARELINRIQNLRKTKNFEITDHIDIFLQNNTAIHNAVENFKTFISDQVLANTISWADENFKDTLDIGDISIGITLKK